jgi:hypothetical protein
LANFTGFTIPQHLGLAHGDEEPAVARSHPRVYLGSSDLRSSSFNAHDAVAFGLDAASGMDSLVSITFQCQDLRLVRLTGHGRTLKARNANQTGNLGCRQ